MTLQHSSARIALANTLPPPGNLDATTPSLVQIFWQLTDAQRIDRFASTDAVAARYKISQRTIQRWIKEGRIAAIPIGRKYQVDLDSLKTHLETLFALLDAD